MEDEKFPFVLEDEYTDKVTIEWFSPNDVLMIVSNKKGGAVHYIAGKMYKGLNLTLESYESIWYKYGFRATDRSNVVNMNKVRYFDESYRILYFEDRPSKNSLSAAVAAVNVDSLKRMKEECNIIFSGDLKKHDPVEKNKSLIGRLITN